MRRSGSPRAREADVVGGEDLAHFRPHQPQDQRHLEEGKRKHRQDDGFPAGHGQQPRRPPADRHRFAAPEGGQPPQLHREDIDQPDTDQEIGKRHADERCRHDDVGNAGIRLQRGQDAQEHADGEGQDERQDGQFQRSRQALHDELEHRLADARRNSEISLQRRPDEPHELHRKWLVETERGFKLGSVGSRRILSEHVLDRITDEAERGERQESGDQHHWHRLPEPAKQEEAHSATVTFLTKI